MDVRLLKALKKDTFTDPDPVRWMALADHLEESGYPQSAKVWRRRAEWYPGLRECVSKLFIYSQIDAYHWQPNTVSGLCDFGPPTTGYRALGTHRFQLQVRRTSRRVKFMVRDFDKESVISEPDYLHRTGWLNISIYSPVRDGPKVARKILDLIDAAYRRVDAEDQTAAEG